VESLTSESATSHRTIAVDLDDLGSQPGEQGIPRQRPFAAVRGCSDARVLIELIFNEGPNDLFVVRVAGNGLGTDVLGSLRYAIEHLRDGCGLWSRHNGCGVKHRRRDARRQP
jgi:carbonic anhydrase